MTARVMDPRTPSPPSFHVPKSSPLDSLVRRASSRRTKNKDALQVPHTPPRGTQDNQEHSWHQSPVSPLLHTQFRTSVASTSVSAYDARSMILETELHPDGYDPHPYRSSRSSQATTITARQVSMASQYSVDEIAASYRDSYAQLQPPPSPTPSHVPTVVVSSDTPPSIPATQGQTGRVPSRLPPGTANFSRPVIAQQSYSSSSMPPPVQPPPSHPVPPTPSETHNYQRPPINGSEEQKRRVLMRHAHSAGSGLVMNASNSNNSTSPVLSAPTPRPPQLRPSSSATESVYSIYSYYPYEGSPHPSPTTPQEPYAPVGMPAAGSSQPHLVPQMLSQVQGRTSPGGSPNLHQTSVQTRTSPQLPPPQVQVHPPPQLTTSSRSQSHVQPARSPKLTADAALPLSEPQTAQDYLQLGITHHLANRLTESAQCFEKSASLNGGCGVGMLMWGLTQRHGWGVEKNEDKGFRWLRKAAEMAVVDLEKGGGVDRGAVKSELVLAIYEVGQSFFRGWGVEKDKKMAVSYFQLAAKLGDPDAQQDLAFCLANGKGCKKDRKEAAKWYRAAVAQGASDIGLTWIYKEKYQ